ncbi:hypothetical protein PoB_003310900 [Plakobranchus ocellatus]|uniref:Uncharacterized protein n=1 Tax=Plakobranchus ocellatus TaxID=259542 RepID=A0AAV4AG04_9GAST|nr:hypothetical protein PoB_003310900 [Plakobranchus ocellatus]
MKTRRFQAFRPSVRPGRHAGKARTGHGKISADLRAPSKLVNKMISGLQALHQGRTTLVELKLVTKAPLRIWGMIRYSQCHQQLGP